MIKEAISKAVQNQNLIETEASSAMQEIMSGKASAAQIASLITALRMKGETAEEITGFAKVMRQFATKIQVKAAVDVDAEDINIDKETILDTCGTGGDGTNTFNVSTATALVVAACGLTVAKHGNRAVSSACGSADVLEELGVNLDVSKEKVENCLSQIGIGFLFAPALHGAMKHAVAPRKEIGIRTVFNVLGPLTNPAGANSQILGVYNESLLKKMAEVLKNLGTQRAWVVNSEDGLDEISVTAPTKVAELKNGKIKTFTIKPKDFKIDKASISDIKGGNAKQNAQIIKDILSGEKGAKRDIVLLNSAAGLLVGNKVSTMREGIELASDSIDSGKAREKLARLVRLTNE
ncbi:anthranilate phosphoribosyltransferase [Elusimicrobiota bacterium]